MALDYTALHEAEANFETAANTLRDKVVALAAAEDVLTNATADRNAAQADRDQAAVVVDAANTALDVEEAKVRVAAATVPEAVSGEIQVGSPVDK